MTQNPAARPSGTNGYAMGKKERQARIMELVRQQNIETQEELVRRLCGEGFAVTQATVSRDIRELRLQKRRVGRGAPRYVAPEEGADTEASRHSRVMREGVVSMDRAQNILVIRTVTGMAMGVAAALDAMHFPEMVGCIAGDDTIMVAVRTSAETLTLMEKLEAIIQATE